MINNSILIPILFIGKLFNLPSDITQSIYFYIIHNYAQLIIDKWYSYIVIHNTNLCYIATKIPHLHIDVFFGDTISYYDLCDYKLYITLSICSKYFKPSISDKTWWNNFVQYGFNGLLFLDDHDMNNIVHNNLIMLTNIYNSLQ